MRSLHVAALAFPTQQGTQAALHGMLCALSAAGHDTHLLCYPIHQGAKPDVEMRPYHIHRVPGPLRQRSTRSGPSFEKGLLDVALAVRAARLCAELSPDLIVAHHVEAGLCGLLLRQRVLFLAHTSLRTELPSYFPRPVGGALAFLGAGLDRFLCARHPGALAVSPLLARLLSAEPGCPVGSIGIPWPLALPTSAEERRAARQRLNLSPEHEVVLYAGNLDAYQGLDALVSALATLAVRRPKLVWLLATGSSPDAFARKLAASGLAQRTVITSLEDESHRRRVHAAADVCVVPRGAAGGVPVKLLDTLARGAPVVTTRMACAGLAIPPSAVTLVEESGGWDGAIERVLAGQVPEPTRGRDYISQAHQGPRFVSDLIAHATREGLLLGRA